MFNGITKWLEGLGLGEYANLFAEQRIDQEVLRELTDADLKELGIPLGPRKKLLKAIRSASQDALKSPGPPQAALPPNSSETQPGLSAWERMPGERKPVTMLFADVTGSTALTEKLDAEETHDLLYGATQRMCEAIEKNRGTVCRFMGDGVMAMFGAPVASERHAVDACEAALEMQQAIRDYADDVEARHGSRLQIRVGLHSGEVVVLTVGEGEKADYDASGPTVPIAARMEQVAEPGEVYLTATTQALAAERIEAQTLEPVCVKGISEPLAVFALRRVRSPEEVRADSRRTPFVGRRGELVQFRAMLETCIEEGHGQTIYVRGEPGIGKTRLVEEFARIAAERGVSTHRGLELPFGVGQGQDAIRSLVRGLLGIPIGSGKAVRQLAARTALADSRLDPDQTVFLNDLLNLPQPKELRALYDAMDNPTRNDGKQAVVSSLMIATSSRRPLLAIVEDVHWADAVTLAYLAALAKTVAKCPALLVMTSRIEGDQLGRHWHAGTRDSPFITIDLGPLETQDSVALITEFIEPTDPLAERCLARAGGNPLFLEQLLRSAREGSTVSLPDSIQSLVLARMDRLPAADRRALQVASVIGQRFELGLLRQLLDSPQYDCSVLVERRLVRWDGAVLRFAHALIQEGAYRSLLKRSRRALHVTVGEKMSQSDPVLCARHLDRGDDRRAASAYLTAARAQAVAHELDSALRLTERGLALAVARSERYNLSALEGELRCALGQPDGGIAAYRRALDLARDPIEGVHARIGLAEGLRLTEQHDQLLAVSNEAETLAREHCMNAALARIQQLRGSAHFVRGELKACVQANERSLKYARESGSVEAEAQALSNLADAEYARGRFVSAYAKFARCIELCRAEGLVRIEAANLGMHADGLLYQNRMEAFFAENEAALSLARRLRDPRAEAVALISRCSGLLDVTGDPEAARPAAERCVALARGFGSRSLEAFGLVWCGHVCRLSGERAEAMLNFEAALAICRDQGMEFCGPLVFGGIALTSVDWQQSERALQQADSIIARGCLGHNHLHYYPMAMEASLQHQDWDAATRYAAALEEYTDTEPLPWCTFWSARGRALAEFRRGRRDEGTVQELRRLRDYALKFGLVLARVALDQALDAIDAGSRRNQPTS
ncbi:MAG: AAA family ATPase [Gammaproteobacteria bacterium]|nr:AAA family ATPase [Gammaproteobacteria bacterium]NIR82461.1 AAA family ATPase [Gammaproteobacteria bacterium]NIR88457.1 AAA family ATPase [Gammaproteobacteria bacterium]NIU03597.1 AAA family ATPase [Gammaproteobacteria bacterium]NIV50949.1 AAA family ATPase [Gammaproteobacteria bacterium]